MQTIFSARLWTKWIGMEMERSNMKVHDTTKPTVAPKFELPHQLTQHVYAEFRTFVEQAEVKLFGLFKAIDKDGNGKLDLTELQGAFKSAGLTVSSRKLNDFFTDMDFNNDGYISFEEWRYV